MYSSAQLQRLKPPVQLLGTLLILAFVLGNLVKTIVLLFLWVLTFYPFKLNEIILFCGTCLFFSVMDVVVIKRGNFFYKHPDVGLLPLWEFFMYGFYFLHTIRVLNGTIPRRNTIKAGLLALAFALAFGCISY